MSREVGWFILSKAMAVGGRRWYRTHNRRNAGRWEEQVGHSYLMTAPSIVFSPIGAKGTIAFSVIFTSYRGSAPNAKEDPLLRRCQSRLEYPRPAWKIWLSVQNGFELHPREYTNT